MRNLIVTLTIPYDGRRKQSKVLNEVLTILKLCRLTAHIIHFPLPSEEVCPR